MSKDSSTKKGGLGLPPLMRVMLPELQASRTAMRTAALAVFSESSNCW